jgi:hypothetical protein
MYGKVLERTRKRARWLEEQTRANERDEERLSDDIREEFSRFCCTSLGIPFASLHPKDGVYELNVSYSVSVSQRLYDQKACISGNKGIIGYYNPKSKMANVTSVEVDIPQHVEDVLRNFYGTVLPAWKEAVETRDYESFACARVLRWIGRQLPEWRDIFSAKFPME